MVNGPAGETSMIPTLSVAAAELAEMQAAAGATFSAIAGRSIPASFGNDALAGRALRTGVALTDRSHWGLLEFSGPDRLDYLHNQTTNDMKALQPGSGCDTAIVTPTARLVDLATAYATEETVLLLVSPQRRATACTWLKRLIPFSNARVEDVGDRQATFTVLGPQSDILLKTLELGDLVGQPYASHQQQEVAGTQVRVAAGSSLATHGYTFVVPYPGAARLWQAIVAAGAVPTGAQVWEQWRVQQGRPMPDSELTEEYNPLEAGLWHAISFTKGCYIGQETIARLDTYKGVKLQLWGIQLDTLAPVGTDITLEGKRVGTLTSLTETEAGPFGLGYIRTKAGGVGLEVQVGESRGTVVNIPYPTRERQ
jgi:hypothetical protein